MLDACLKLYVRYDDAGMRTYEVTLLCGTNLLDPYAHQ